MMIKQYNLNRLLGKTGRALLLLLFSAGLAHAQTVLVSPTGEGGFELGTGSFADNGWTVANGSVNKWFTGSGKTSGAYSFPSASRCAYISNDNGTTWAYASSTNDASHFYRDIVFPAGQTVATLTFKFQHNGNNARLLVHLCDSTAMPVVGQPNSGSVTLGAGAWGTGSSLLLATAAGQAAGTVTYKVSLPPSALANCNMAIKKRLVFTWNGSTSVANPPAAIDEIAVVSEVPAAAAPAVFTLNNTQPTGGTNFNTFTDAINWINAVSRCGIGNPVTINVPAGQVFAENVPMLTARGTAANPIVFRKSGAGVNPQIRPDGTGPSYAQASGTAEYGMCLMGTEYVTIDGIDIRAANASIDYGYFIGIASPTRGASNNTIMNCAIMLDRSNAASKALVQSASNLTGMGSGLNLGAASSASGTNRNNKYLNLDISNVYAGVAIYGTSENLADENNTVGTTAHGVFNTIGNPSVPNDIGGGTALTYGVYALYQKNITIHNNRVSNVTGTGSNTTDGILLGSPTFTYGGVSGFENKVYNNIVTNIANTSTTSTALVSGIRIVHELNLGMVKTKVYNNVIHKIRSGYTGNISATRAVRGLYLQSSSAANTAIYEVVNNTIIIDGTAFPNLSNIAFEGATPEASFVLRNNLLVNRTGAQTGAATHTVLAIGPAGSIFDTVKSMSDYNDLYLANAVNGSIAPGLATFSDWRNTHRTDASSISAEPLLNSEDVLFPLYTSPLVGACPSLSTPYDRDVLGNPRNATQSTIGAYERSGDVIAPLIADTTLLGETSTANRALNNLLVVTDGGSMVATMPGTAPRIYYKKSTDANVFGPNHSSANGWKWAEAVNTVSPFSFVIDYSLLQSPAAAHDMIQYFFVAQDTVGTPNVAALPSQGFAGASVASITSAPAQPKYYFIYNAPASFATTEVAAASAAKVITGETSQAMLRVGVVTASGGDSGYVSALSFRSTGISGSDNIANARVWYTGASRTFAATRQFGPTLAITPGTGAIGNFTIYGAQPVAPGDTAYFWLAYDIRTNGIASDSVDAEAISVKYDGIDQAVTSGSPVSSRIIKAAYCIPVSSSGYEITNVSLNTLLNATSGGAAPFYTNYAPAGAGTTVLKKGASYPLSVTTSSSSAGVVVYIDYNDDGVFDEPAERILVTPQGLAGVPNVLRFTVPCSAVASPAIRMRVRSFYYSNITQGCTTGQPGEVEDYTIAIQDNPAAYVSSAVMQPEGTVAPAATNKVMARIAVVAQGCGAGILDEIACHANQTNNLSAITAARLYTTGTAKVFHPNNPLAVHFAPPGNILFTMFSDTLSTAPGDTSYYWIAYDVAAGAALNDTLDIRVDSIRVAGSYHVPSGNNPAQYQLVKPVNMYLSSQVVHPVSARTPKIGQPNSPVMMLRIVTTNAGAPRQLTSLSLGTAGGGNDTMNIGSAKVFYTGNSAVFNPSTLFGSYEYVTPLSASWPAYVVSGSQYLLHDTNYFWIAYDIKPTAAQGDSVDAELASFVLDGSTIVPGVSSLGGNFKLTPAYCASTYQGLSSPAAYLEELLNVTFGTLNNSSTCAQTGGPGSVLNIYSDYSELIAAPAIPINQPTAFSFTGRAACSGTAASNSTVFKAYIDLNQDGDFSDAGENVYTSAGAQGSLTVARTVSGSIVVPCSASLGLTRMRVVYAGANAPAAAACGIAGWYGETEDYTINIVPNPVTYVSASAAQVSAIVAPGSANVQVLRVGIKTIGCGTAAIDALYFHTTGTAAGGSISAAKLYTTGKANTFANAVLLNTVGSPAGAFGFTALGATAADHAPADTSYFWLVYDISGSAATGTTADAVLDSVSVLGMRIIPAVAGNPAGELAITAKMVFAGASATHPDLSTVAMGARNRAVLRVLVRGTSGGAAIQVSDLTFTTNGGINDLVNIDSARVYYTGRSPVFATTTPFGAAYAGTTSPWGTFTVSGNQLVSADTAYFWLAYDIKASANLYDSVDAELVSLVYDGASQPVTGGAPAGSIGIKNEYCAAQGMSAGANILNITNVTTGGINSSSACAAANRYRDFTALAPAVMPKGSSVGFSLSTGVCGFLPIFAANAAVYIDFDQSGSFDATERVYTSTGFDPSAGISTGLFIPCTAREGLTRMRVIINTGAIAAPCGTINQPGEVEDYPVNITGNPVAYQAGITSQQNGSVAQGGTSQQITRLRIKASGCGVAQLNEIRLNTAGTVNASGTLVAAKLYATGTSTVFNTGKLVASAFAPAGAFTFTLSDTLLSDTNNYWIAYDISGGAVNGSVVDAAVDSFRIGTSYYIPTDLTPAAYKTIEAPLLFSTVEFAHSAGDRVPQGAQALLGKITVITSGPGAPIRLTAFNLSAAGGGVDTANIASARLYYTGNSGVFAATTPFGLAYTPSPAATAAGKWMPYTIAGNQALAADTNYFWLVYQLRTTARTGDSVDAVLNGIEVEGFTYAPSITSPAGNAVIRKDYCIPGDISGRCIDTTEIGSIRNYSGVNCTSPYYTLYPNAGLTRTDAYAGSSLPIRLTFASAARASVFIDLNRDGEFDITEEFDLTGSVSVPAVNTSIAIPVQAMLGETRLRIRSFGGQSVGFITNRACDDWNQSETEDYTLNILPPLPQATYVWNKTTAADFMADTNWTPVRAAASPGDRLVFPASAAVYNVPAQAVKAVEIADQVTLQLTAPVASYLTVSDTLVLGNFARVYANAGLSVELGVSTGIPGTLVKGYEAGIQARMKRWITGTGTTEFPLINAKGSKAVSIAYQSAPVPGSLTVSYETASAGGSGGFPLYESGTGIYVNRVTSQGYWDLVPSSGLSGGLYTGTFRCDSLQDAPNVSYLVLVNRSNAFSNWTLNGNHQYTTGSALQPELTRTSVYGYGQFAVASDSVLNPLPVSLARFTGSREGRDARLEWLTAAERNNAGFEVERSADGRTFNPVGFVKGAGTSSVPRAYAFYDRDAFKAGAAWYYRLRQTDLDGAITYSAAIKLTGDERSLQTLSVYPNPVTDQANIALHTSQATTVRFVLSDLSGRQVLVKEALLPEGEQVFPFTGTAALSSGVYFLRIEWDGHATTEKIVKQ